MADNFTNNNYIQAPPVLPAGGPAPCLQRQYQAAGGYTYVGEDRMLYPPNIIPRSINGCLSADYSNPHIGMNYNHLPYSSGITSSVMTTLSSIASVSVGLGVTAPGSFTFTSPARLMNICSAPSQTNGYGHFTPAPAPQTFAPGLGASWQHAIPTQMPWTESGSTAVPPIFTGSMAYNYSDCSGINQWSQSMEPIPSCSTPPRRPKRTAISDGCELPKKLHISEEKMTASMQELSLCNHGYDTMNGDDEMEDSFPTSTQASIEKSWKKFKELEDMLLSEKSTSSATSGVKLHLNPSVAEKILSSTEILPKDVLETISKPCMQIVLWKPPADKLREVVTGNVSKSRWKECKASSSSSGSRSVLAQSQSSPTCSPALRTPITSTAIPISRQPMIVIGDMEEDTAMEL